MNSYIILHNMETYSRKMLLSSYQREGFEIVYEIDNTVCLKKTETEVDNDTELGMLKVICSQLRRSIRDKAVTADVSDLINSNIERLTANKLSSLKFHDRFNDETRNLVTRLLVGNSDEI